MSHVKPDIACILEYYGATNVPKRRSWAAMKCPFHSDSHASAAINSEENIFKCHGCSMKGDGYAIIMAKEGVKFNEAVDIAQRILDQGGQVLSLRSTTSGGLPRRTGNYSGASNKGAIGRRARTSYGS